MRALSFNSPQGNCLALLRDSGESQATIVEPSGDGSYGTGLAGLIGVARREGVNMYDLLARLAERSYRTVHVDFSANVVRDGQHELPLEVPIDAPEIWAAGVSYLRSRHAREAESGGQSADFYGRVYDAKRPELFLKDSACRRTVPPGVAVAVRGDSSWTVPEPELGLVLNADGRIVGYTIGNDVSARDIEGENPLYLPQSKTYARSCSLGPAVWFPPAGMKPEPFEMTLRVYGPRGELSFEDTTSTTTMRRSFEELASYLARYNVVHDGTVLLTGTGIVPPDEFALEAGDHVDIEVPRIGVLRNPVVRLEPESRFDRGRAPAGEEGAAS